MFSEIDFKLPFVLIISFKKYIFEFSHNVGCLSSKVSPVFIYISALFCFRSRNRYFSTSGIDLGKKWKDSFDLFKAIV